MGISHKECPVAIREKLHFSKEQIDLALREARAESSFSELVILSTCNRVEFYGVAHSEQEGEAGLLRMVERIHGISSDEFRPYLYRHSGTEALRHIFRVAAGLDSLVVGENEILGQVRDAFRAADRLRALDSLLYRLMEKALKTGKEVRTQTRINKGAVSIPSVAVELAEKIFGKLVGEKIMVLGTGEMSILTLKNLGNAGAEILYVVSRNQEKGESVAKEAGAEWVALDDWGRYLTDVDILISSTAAPHPIVHYDQVREVMNARRHRPLFLIDIAVPRDIEARVNEIDDVYLYNIDDLKGVSASNLRLRRSEIQAAEELVEHSVGLFNSWLKQLEVRPTMERFEIFLSDILDKELSRISSHETLDENKRRELRDRISAKLLHQPLSKIKEASRNGGVAKYVEALQALFGLEQKPHETDHSHRNAR
ncbi:MAG: glutamyl-tRNA reductase [Candidatus Omnitrophota bacterium]|nr:glutamyl-tRNA reductase [Candidatus Omnitrophota bacterium]